VAELFRDDAPGWTVQTLVQIVAAFVAGVLVVLLGVLGSRVVGPAASVLLSDDATSAIAQWFGLTVSSAGAWQVGRVQIRGHRELCPESGCRAALALWWFLFLAACLAGVLTGHGRFTIAASGVVVVQAVWTIVQGTKKYGNRRRSMRVAFIDVSTLTALLLALSAGGAGALAGATQAYINVADDAPPAEDAPETEPDSTDSSGGATGDSAEAAATTTPERQEPTGAAPTTEVPAPKRVCERGVASLSTDLALKGRVLGDSEVAALEAELANITVGLGGCASRVDVRGGLLVLFTACPEGWTGCSQKLLIDNGRGDPTDVERVVTVHNGLNEALAELDSGRIDFVHERATDWVTWWQDFHRRDDPFQCVTLVGSFDGVTAVLEGGAQFLYKDVSAALGVVALPVDVVESAGELRIRFESSWPVDAAVWFEMEVLPTTAARISSSSDPSVVLLSASADRSCRTSEKLDALALEGQLGRTPAFSTGTSTGRVETG
jgi:hypothetical protein